MARRGDLLTGAAIAGVAATMWLFRDGEVAGFFAAVFGFPLLALSMAAFITLVTEGLPAGVLPEMASDFSVSESAIGQAVTIYAIATGLSTIPLARARWAPRDRSAGSNYCSTPPLRVNSRMKIRSTAPASPASRCRRC